MVVGVDIASGVSMCQYILLQAPEYETSLNDRGYWVNWKRMFESLRTNQGARKLRREFLSGSHIPLIIAASCNSFEPRGVFALFWTTVDVTSARIFRDLILAPGDWPFLFLFPLPVQMEEASLLSYQRRICGRRITVYTCIYVSFLSSCIKSDLGRIESAFLTIFSLYCQQLNAKE